MLYYISGFPIHNLQGSCSNILELNSLILAILSRFSFVCCCLFDFGVFEYLREEPLIKPLQVLRVFGPDEVLPLLDKGPDGLALHQLVVSHLEWSSETKVCVKSL